MALSELPYRDIVEIRNVGRRRANILLEHDWVLLDWKVEEGIQRRDVGGTEGDPQAMWFRVGSIHYILGRPSAVEFTSASLHNLEQREEGDRRDEHRVGAQHAEGIEESVREGLSGESRRVVPIPEIVEAKRRGARADTVSISRSPYDGYPL